MTALRAEPATTEAFRLGEGPLWDAARRRLLWVDVLGGAVLEGRLAGGRVEVTGRTGFDGTVGAVCVAEDGSLLVAAQEGLVVVRADGTRLPGPRIVPAGGGRGRARGPPPPPPRRGPAGGGRRLNDGATDPAGRFLVGTLSLLGPSDREVLVRVEPDGALTELDSDLTLSNGLAWSGDGRRLFSVDTRRRVVWVRDYDVTTGAVGERQVHLQLADGFPDGIAVDAADHLWLAVWGAGEVRRYAPDGSLVRRVEVAAPHTSSVAFAGDDLRLLVITTATDQLSGQQMRDFPDSGRLFATTVDVPGLPLAPWRGPGTAVAGASA